MVWAGNGRQAISLIGLQWARLACAIVFAASLFALSGCGSSDIEEELQPAKLSEIKMELETPVQWKQSIDGESHSAVMVPSLTLEQYFAATEDGRLYSYNLKKKGSVLWSNELGLPLSSGVGGDSKNLAVGTRDGEVLFLSQQNGKVLWRQQVSSEVLARPLLTDNIVVVRTADAKLFGLQAGTGQQVWVYERKVPALSLHGNGAPVSDGKAVYAGFDNGSVVALSLADGKELWEVTLTTPTGRSELERMVDVDADPIIDGNVLYAVSYQGRVVALEAATGRTIWFRDMSAFRNMALDQHNLYITSASSHVWALDRNTGATFWKLEALSARDLTAPVVHGEYVVVGDFEGWLHWLSREDGHILARVRIDESKLDNGPVVAGGELIARSHGGVLAAYLAQLVKKKNKK